MKESTKYLFCKLTNTSAMGCYKTTVTMKTTVNKDTFVYNNGMVILVPKGQERPVFATNDTHWSA